MAASGCCEDPATREDTADCTDGIAVDDEEGLCDVVDDDKADKDVFDEDCW